MSHSRFFFNPFYFIIFINPYIFPKCRPKITILCTYDLRSVTSSLALIILRPLPLTVSLQNCILAIIHPNMLHIHHGLMKNILFAVGKLL